LDAKIAPQGVTIASEFARYGIWGLRAPARCSTVPVGTNAASKGGCLKLTVVRRTWAGQRLEGLLLNSRNPLWLGRRNLLPQAPCRSAKGNLLPPKGNPISPNQTLRHSPSQGGYEGGSGGYEGARGGGSVERGLRGEGRGFSWGGTSGHWTICLPLLK
jgi:hypothetical protein